MGANEERLKKIVDGPRWNADALLQVKRALEDVIAAYKSAQYEPGWQGASADAAVQQFTALVRDASANSDAIDELVIRINRANNAIDEAARTLGDLPEGSIDPAIKAAVVGGASVVLPGLGTVASLGALSLAENAMSGGREDAAKGALDTFGQTTDTLAEEINGYNSSLKVPVAKDGIREISLPPVTHPSQSDDASTPHGSGGAGGGSGPGALPSSGAAWAGGDAGSPGGASLTGGPSGHSSGVADHHGDAGGDTSSSYPRPSVDGGLQGGVLGSPVGSGGSAGTTSAHLGGLSGGAGAAGSGGSLGGLGLLGGAGGGAAMVAGARAASGGAKGLSGGVLGTKAGMGGVTSGIPGAGGSTGASAGATNAGARGGNAMMGGNGARPGDEEEKERRGLGLFAPKLDDDDEAPALPKSAGAGSRAPKDSDS